MTAKRRGYYVDGKRVPGVTTITGRFKESGGLIHWAWDLGMQGINYRETRDEAASSGHIGHDMIETFLLDGNLDDYEFPADAGEDTIAAAESGFAMYQKWSEQSKLRVIDTEVEMVSERHRFGGRCDAVGFVSDELCILDWKTSGALYVETLLQVVGYKILWEETRPDQPITGGVHVCRFSKDHADFEHRHFASDLDHVADVFLRERKLYEDLQQLKRRVR